MQSIKLKPLSINEAYTGQRFKTTKCRSYCKAALLMIRKEKLPPPPYQIIMYHGQSNFVAADWDGPIKVFQDVLCKKYGIDDKIIYSGYVEKVKVEKGSEFIAFELITHQPRFKF